MSEQPDIRVVDRPTENGVRINNVLTGLLLAAALWVGSSVESLKEAVVILATNQEHNVTALDEVRAEQKDHDGRIRILERLHPEFYNNLRGE